MSDIKFGMMNVETGETQEGYMENGEMKFKKLPWYKRLFQSAPRPPRKKEFIKSTLLTCHYPWGNSYNFNASVYKEFNPLTGQIYSLYAETDGEKVYFNVDAYVKEGRFIDA